MPFQEPSKANSEKKTSREKKPSTKFQNRLKREAAGKAQAWKCARTAADRAAKILVDRWSQKLESVESRPGDRGEFDSQVRSSVGEAAREAYLKHLQVPVE